MPSIAEACMKPMLGRVEAAITPGLTLLTWSSMNIEKFIADVQRALTELKNFTKKVSPDYLCFSIYDKMLTVFTIYPLSIQRQISTWIKNFLRV